jgi:hypothetical protein
MKTLKMRFTGVRPLLMHNGRLADPLCQYTREMKKITGKGRKKTDEDLLELRHLEWRGGMYEDDKGRPCIPGDNIHAALVEGARKQRLGKDVDAGILVDAVSFPLKFNGPKKLDELYSDPRFVDVRGAVVGQGRVMRTRPKFNEWSLDIEVGFDPSMINEEQLLDAAIACGEKCGLGDNTPRYGRFTVDKI